jgi:hypothetical protein
MSWINTRRLRDYPRLMLLATWTILLFNLLLHQGWLGGVGQIIGGDFIMFYATGLMYRTEPARIYDYEEQFRVQQALIEPTVMPGLNPYMNPPYVAMAYSLLPNLPLAWALLAWSLLTILCAVLAVRWLIPLAPRRLQGIGLDTNRLTILVLSFFPFIEGLQAGQNHGLTLMLVTGMVIGTLKERWLLAGVCAGLLLYKPQFILGFLIIWLVWRQFKTLATVASIAALWGGSYLLLHGWAAYHTYNELSQVFLLLPYIKGFPAYLLVTFYGLLTTLLPQSVQPILYRLDQLLIVLLSLGLAWVAYRLRRHPPAQRIPALALALLLPLIAFPYALLHDMLILIPGFILWAGYAPSRGLLYAAILVYLGAFFLTPLAALSKVGLMAGLTLGLLIALFAWLYKNRPQWLQPGLPHTP